MSTIARKKGIRCQHPNPPRGGLCDKLLMEFCQGRLGIAHRTEDGSRHFTPFEVLQREAERLGFIAAPARNSTPKTEEESKMAKDNVDTCPTCGQTVEQEPSATPRRIAIWEEAIKVTMEARRVREELKDYPEAVVENELRSRGLLYPYYPEYKQNGINFYAGDIVPSRHHHTLEGFPTEGFVRFTLRKKPPFRWSKNAFDVMKAVAEKFGYMIDGAVNFCWNCWNDKGEAVILRDPQGGQPHALVSATIVPDTYNNMVEIWIAIEEPRGGELLEECLKVVLPGFCFDDVLIKVIPEDDNQTARPRKKKRFPFSGGKPIK